MQLVELQETVAGRNDEVAAFAVSYDPVRVLAAFAEARGITYPLLADVGSNVIEALGLRNEGIAAERAYWGRETTDRHAGLPYPATFVLDEAGVVVDKIMKRSHRNRPTGRSILEDLGILAADAGAEVWATDGTEEVAATAWTASRAYFPNQIFRVGMRIAVVEGMHLYVPPTSDDYISLEVGLDAPAGVYWDAPALPEGAPAVLAGIDEQVWVVEGTVDLSVPVHIHEDVGDVTLAVVVRFQACSDDTCLIPDTLRMELPLTSRGKI